MSLSLAAYQEMTGRESGTVWLALVTVSHPDMASPLRFVRNNEPVTSSVEGSSNTYLPLFMDVVLVSELDDGGVPEVILRVGAVDRVVEAALDGLDVPPSVDIRYVLDSDPDTAVAENLGLTLRSYRTSLSVLEARLEGPNFLSEPVPGVLMDPTNTPLLFP